MKLHLVGGFLGSGKTTAIIQAARCLIAEGKKVGVVTNDQGKYLVDTAFFRLGNIPAVEVTGGCFCCNYDDLEARLDQIQAEIRPDVVFAESVGSCGDLVATVIKPLVDLRGGDFQPSSFSVFTDCRLLQMHFSGEGLPFSENVNYIFEKQIEEAGVLILNKSDLLEPQALNMLVAAAKGRFPGLAIRAQSSMDAQDVRGWLDWIEDGAALPQTSLSIDYQRYGDGEAQLAWLDETVWLDVPDGQGQQVAVRLIGAIRDAIRERRAAIGHMKFIIEGKGAQAKVSMTTLPVRDEDIAIPVIPGKRVSFLVNARVEMPAHELRYIVAQALTQVSAEMNGVVFENEVSYFHPNFPTPTHRIG